MQEVLFGIFYLYLFMNFRWVTKLVEAVQRDEDEEGYLPNVYYSPELENAFITILSRIPLWSNVMVGKFNSNRYCASSAESENYFKRLKADSGKTTIPSISIDFLYVIRFISFAADLHQTQRSDLFVEKHIADMESELTLAFSKAVKQKDSDKNE